MITVHPPGSDSPLERELGWRKAAISLMHRTPQPIEKLATEPAICFWTYEGIVRKEQSIYIYASAADLEKVWTSELADIEKTAIQKGFGRLGDPITDPRNLPANYQNHPKNDPNTPYPSYQYFICEKNCYKVTENQIDWCDKKYFGELVKELYIPGIWYSKIRGLARQEWVMCC